MLQEKLWALQQDYMNGAIDVYLTVRAPIFGNPRDTQGTPIPDDMIITSTQSRISFLFIINLDHSITRGLRALYPENESEVLFDRWDEYPIIRSIFDMLSSGERREALINLLHKIPGNWMVLGTTVSWLDTSVLYNFTIQAPTSDHIPLMSDIIQHLPLEWAYNADVYSYEPA